jgi:ABC-type multidrug transport system fused ATPase/permease subunit
MTLLFKATGMATLVAVICMLIINIIQHRVGKIVGKMRRKLVIFTEQRIKITNEVLQGIRIIKFYSWLEPTLERITKLREKEVEYVTKYQLARMVNTAFMFLGPVIISFTLFLSFVLLGIYLFIYLFIN